jgi:hypothetical protein
MKAQDKIFFETGVENDEFESSITYYETHDKDVQQKMNEYMLRMKKL